MKKILSIDGGGIRGLIPAMVLTEIERRTNQPISKSFDLIAGTSTGGILALGLSKADESGQPEFSAKALSEIYTNHGKTIFPQGTWASAARHLWVGFGMSEKIYSHQGLEEVLRDKVGNATLGDALGRVLISTYDIVGGEPVFFKSWDGPHKAVKMVDVARATSAAPTYFEPHQVTITYEKEEYFEKYNLSYKKEKFKKIIVEKVIDGKEMIEKTYTLVDGGICINSPAVSAYAEAKRLFPEEQDFLVLSLGTGQINPETTYQQARAWGMASWARPLIKFMFDGVSDVADYQLRNILSGEPKRYYRMQTDIHEDSGAMDLASDENILRLINGATSLIREQDANLNELCGLLSGS
ncbi:MAG: patatin-like phospholipase family protein [Spirulina sp.]